MKCELAILLVTALHQASSVCDSDWTSKGLHCYYFSDTAASFPNASDFCARSQAQLTDISDDSENVYLFSTAVEPAGVSYWIGYEQVITNIWRWISTGKQAQFLKWDIGEPDGKGDCARLTPFTRGVWRDHTCESQLRFICKKLADCGEPDPMVGADVTFSIPSVSSHSANVIYPVTTQAYYTCKDGYEYEDGAPTKDATCELGGIWRPNLVSDDPCQPKKCPPPPRFNYLHLNATTDEFHDFGAVIAYSCDQGYWFSSFESQAKYLTCQSDKQWRGDNVTDCSIKYCIRPVTSNSVANTSLNTLGTVAIYRCVTGYQFADKTTAKIFTCGAETWNPPPERCIIKTCPVHDVVNASPSTPSVVYDTTVVWSCNKGMQYLDTSTRKSMYCQENEEWDHPITDECLCEFTKSSI